MLLETLLSQIHGVALRGDPKIPIAAVAYDSRNVSPGALFVAIKGQKTSGELFIDDAVNRGAAAVATESIAAEDTRVPFMIVPDARRFLAEAARLFWKDPARELKLVAVTGTNGKTTTTYLVEAILRQAGLKPCVIGTLGTQIGDRRFPGERTTPEATDLTRLLRQAVDGGCTCGALEVSSHALALQRVYGMKFTAGVFTNLTPDHLDFHGDMESYFRAKSLLFSSAGANEIETAVLNADDPYAMRLAARRSWPIITFGFGERADVRVLRMALSLDATEVKLATPAGNLDTTLRLAGRPNVCNAMAAAAAALSLGIGVPEVERGLHSLEGVPGRMEAVRAGQPFSVLVDYAHTPDALEKLLETVCALPHKRVITVFGCGGDRDRTKRPLMGAVAVRLSDLVIATSDNPRSEDPLAIIEHIRVGLDGGPGAYEVSPDRRKAIVRAFSLAEPGDVVVIAGKGHETYQILGSKVLPFDDREVARDALARLQRRTVGGTKAP